MPLKKSSRLVIALPLTLLAAYGVIAAAPPATGTTPSTLACTATSDTVRTGQASVAVNVRYTEDIGDTLSASVADASKLVVNSARKRVTPMTAELLVNSEQAVVGDWEITLTSGRGTCTGTISVSATKKDKKP